MADIFKPMISYGLNTELRTGNALVSYREPYGNEKSVSIAGDGTAMTYSVGERNFIEVSFDKQTDALRTEWLTFWDAVRTGAAFYYYEDDSYYRSGDAALISGAGISTNDLTNTAATHRQLRVKMDQDEFSVEWDETDGTWTVSLRMRKVP